MKQTFKQNIIDYVNYARNFDIFLMILLFIIFWRSLLSFEDNYRIRSWVPPPGSIYKHTKSQVFNVGYRGPYYTFESDGKFIEIMCEPWPAINECLQGNEKFPERETYDISYVQIHNKEFNKNYYIITSIALKGNEFFNFRERINYIRHTYSYGSFRNEYSIYFYITTFLHILFLIYILLFEVIFPIIIKVFNIKFDR